MSKRWWLPLNMLAWTLAIPLLSISLRYLDEQRILAMSESVVAMEVSALLLWAVFIHVKFVPAASGLYLRIGYFVAFSAMMTLLGAAGLWLSFLTIVAVYGL